MRRTRFRAPGGRSKEPIFGADYPGTCPSTHAVSSTSTSIAGSINPATTTIVATGRTYFRERAFDDLRRLQHDLETTGLDAARDRIFDVARLQQRLERGQIVHAQARTPVFLSSADRAGPPGRTESPT